MPANLLTPNTARPSLLLCVILILVASAGCGTSNAESSSPSTGPADTAQTSMVNAESSTTEPAITTSSTTEALPTHDTINVNFDGSVCSVEDPPETGPGDQAFVFTNESDLPARMKVMVVTEDHTYEDLLAIETENGGPGSSWSGPAWLPEATISFTAVDLELADNQSAMRYMLEPGLHAGLVFTTTSPFVIWLCGPLAVSGS